VLLELRSYELAKVTSDWIASEFMRGLKMAAEPAGFAEIKNAMSLDASTLLARRQK